MILNISSGKKTLKIKIKTQFKKGEEKPQNWKLISLEESQENKRKSIKLDFKKVEDNASRVKD